MASASFRASPPGHAIDMIAVDKTPQGPELDMGLVQAQAGDQHAQMALCFSSLVVNGSKHARRFLRTLSGSPTQSDLNHKGIPLAHVTAGQH